jgi:hypothetical protein
MILTVSKDQSTLYDQIKYSGSPASFGWVLPIAGTVEVGLSSDLLFSTLDQQTQVRVLPPPQNCPVPPDACLRGSSSGGGFSASESAPNDDGVQVLKNEVVGPYETVQLAGGAQDLIAWLTTNGYAVPADVQPVIAWYADQYYNFLALKLQPGKGVQDMRPVRVTSSVPGGATLPLRMVAAGTGPTVGVGLWVVAEGRYEPQNFQSFVLDANELTWDWTKSQSNYVDLRAQKTAAGNGRVWEIESSVSVFKQTVESALKQGSFDGSEAYLPMKDGEGNTLKTAAQVRDEDLATLFQGIPQASARVTRMRADLAHAALDQDLNLTASATQAELPTTRQLTREVNQPQCPVWDGCEQVGTAPRDEAIARSTPGPSSTGSSCAIAPPSTSKTFMAAGLAIAAVAISQALRRRRR